MSTTQSVITVAENLCFLTALVVAGSKIKYISSKNLMDKQNVSGIKTETWLNKQDDYFWVTFEESSIF